MKTMLQEEAPHLHNSSNIVYPSNKSDCRSPSPNPRIPPHNRKVPPFLSPLSQQLAPQQDASNKGKGLKHISETTMQCPNNRLAPQPDKFIMTITSTEHSTVSIMLHTGLQLYHSLPYNPSKKHCQSKIEPHQKSKIPRQGSSKRRSTSGTISKTARKLYKDDEGKLVSKTF